MKRVQVTLRKMILASPMDPTSLKWKEMVKDENFVMVRNGKEDTRPKRRR
ncbi:hypothetical protein A2U01_0032829, partial [Trifolium medium]|nr:hypothetical protein [Trifolium medium]